MIDKGWIEVKNQLPEIGLDVKSFNRKTGVVYPTLYLNDDGKWYDANMVENGGYDKPPTTWQPA
jgi:hypothetical protein